MNDLQRSRRRLGADVRHVLADVDDLLDALRLANAGRAAQARERYDTALRRARIGIARTQAVARARALRAAGEADVYVHRHPWRTAGTVLALGLAVGALVGLLLAHERD